ncbi:MAG: VCBS repeat-containing protein [Thermoanaerobaculia bacterium]
MKIARVLAVLLGCATVAVAQEAPAVEVKPAGDARIVEATLPGHVLGVAATGDGRRLAILTMTDPEALRTVFVLDPRGEAELTKTMVELPSASLAIAGLPSGTVVVGEPGKIFSLGPSAAGPVKLLLESPHLDLSFLERRGMLQTAGIFQPLVGRLLVFRPDDQEILAVADEIALPLEVGRERRGLRLESPPVTVLGRPGGLPPDSPPLVLVGPVARGNTRLLTTWIDDKTRACGDEECEQSRQRWSRLPAPEIVTESFYVDVDGRATLVVATVAADKVGVFERKQLRVFPLWSDRTRAGAAATLKAETTSRRWQEVEIEVLDLGGDGRDDLAVLQRDGLGGKKVVVEVYTGTGNGGFYTASRQTAVTAPDAVWRYGRDADGDRQPDLVVLAEGRLLIFPGVDHKRLVVAKKPRWTFEPPASTTFGDLQLVDLGGDGRYQIVVWSAADGHTWLRVIELG